MQSETQSAYARKYEIPLLILLSLVNGIVALDRLAVNFLSPYIVADMGLTNAQLGLLSSALSGAISISGLVVGAISDATGRPKRILVGMLVLFSILSAGSGLAAGFGGLFLARLLLGGAEGPLVPLTQTLMRDVSHPKRRGFNMGTMQIGGAFLIGAMLGPVIAVSVAEAHGWRMAFFLSALPGLACAAVLIFIGREPARDADDGPAQDKTKTSILSLFRSRNLLVSMAIAVLFTAWLTIQNVFMPVYLVRQIGFEETTMGWILGVAGAGGLIGGLLVPALSDRFGRKPVTIIACFLAATAPLALLFLTQSAVVLAGVLMLSWITIGCAPMVCAIIPSESVPLARITTAIALSMSCAELFGGMLSPPIAGWVGDAMGLRAVFWIDVGLAIGCGLLAFLLRETLPARTKTVA